MALQSIALGWLALISAVDVAYSQLVVPFALAGIGMALVFAPVANVVLSARAARGAGQGLGREQRDPRGRRRVRRRGAGGGVHERGRLRTAQTFVDGLVPAVWMGAACSRSARC